MTPCLPAHTLNISPLPLLRDTNQETRAPMGGWPAALLFGVHAAELPKGFRIKDLPHVGVRSTVEEAQLYTCLYDPVDGSINVPTAYKQAPSDPEAAADAAEQKFRQGVPAFLASNTQFVDMRVQALREEAKAGQAPWAVRAQQVAAAAMPGQQADAAAPAEEDEAEEEEDEDDMSRMIVGYCLAEVWGQGCVVMSPEFLALVEAARARWQAEVAAEAPGAKPQLYFIGGNA